MLIRACLWLDSDEILKAAERNGQPRTPGQ